MVDEAKSDDRPFEADVAKLLHIMVHSVYSEKEVFLRELISNAADACERLRYEAIATPSLLGDDPSPRITLSIDADKRQITIEDNGVGMSRDEMVEALGTIARSGTKAFVDRIQEGKDREEASFIGQFGVGFYSAFMVAKRVDVISRRAGTDEAFRWSSDGKGTFSISAVPLADALARGTHVLLHLMEDATSFTQTLHARTDRQGTVGPRASADLDYREAGRCTISDCRWGCALDQAQIRDFGG